MASQPSNRSYRQSTACCLRGHHMSSTLNNCWWWRLKFFKMRPHLFLLQQRHSPPSPSHPPQSSFQFILPNYFPKYNAVSTRTRYICMSPSVLGYPSSLWSTLLFLGIFVLAFFPNLFIGVLQLPFQLIIPSKPAARTTPPASFPTSPAPIAMASWFQKTITLPARSRGSYLITDNVVNQLPEIKQYRVGILHLFVQHTSCALSMNENWDEDVRADMSDAMDRIVPEDKRGTLYRHSAEGSDDMPVSAPYSLLQPKSAR